MNITGNHRDNPAREIHGKLTERSPNMSQDFHPIRSTLASDAYRQNLDRIALRKRFVLALLDAYALADGNHVNAVSDADLAAAREKVLSIFDEAVWGTGAIDG